MKQIKLKELNEIFDIGFYLNKWNDDVWIEEYRFHHNWDSTGWFVIEDFKLNIKKYADYTVDSLQLYKQGGFRLRMTAPEDTDGDPLDNQ